MAMFFVVRAMVRMQRKEEAPPPAPKTKDCPYCFMSLSIKATRCGHCTSALEAA
jgi:large conductance mechanosensitive channel